MTLRLRMFKGFHMHGTTAYYSPAGNYIVYNRDLDKFPKFKKLILAHEKYHATHRKLPLKHFAKDFWDSLSLRFNPRTAGMIYDYRYSFDEREMKTLKRDYGRDYIAALLGFNVIVGIVNIFADIAFMFVALGIWAKRKYGNGKHNAKR